MAKPPRDLPEGVRGPSGPGRHAVEKRSLPILVRLNRLPRWLVVVGLGALLFLGLIQTGDLAWLGGVLLLIVTGFLFWLLVLAWPVLPTQARIMRTVVVGGALGITILKFMGRF
ncbi:MAG: hypothetical protein Q8M73_13165 [Actinomycetota bacterium]|nr:hypothetical protein [Actinomycetota bacterium]